MEAGLQGQYKVSKDLLKVLVGTFVLQPMGILCIVPPLVRRCNRPANLFQLEFTKVQSTSHKFHTCCRGVAVI